MKVVMYPYRRDDAIIGLTGDFPELDWAVVSSTEELAREIPNATILVTSNRVCTPAFGEALRAHANALRWMFFSSSGVERGVAAANAHLARPERVRRFTLLPAEWTARSGELTPSMKRRRRVIIDRYAKEIEELYS